VFVIKPAHWSTPVGPDGLPRCSYLYQPGESLESARFQRAGLIPPGALPTSIDFALQRREESRSFEALLLADTQPANDAELDYLRDDILVSVLDFGAAFAINHGDIVFDDSALYPRYLEMVGATGIPWHHCPGNHDINWEAREDRSSRETWKRVFGPRHYAFQHADATFILLDNVYYRGHGAGADGTPAYVGRIGSEQLRFVRNLLAHVPREQLVMLSMHIPLLTHQDPNSPADNTADRMALLEILADRPRAVSFSGHMHLTEHHYLGAQEHHHHVLAAASGGWWGGPRDRRGIPLADCPDGVPNGFHVLEVDGTHYATRFVPAAGKARSRLRAVVDGPHRARPGHPKTCDTGAVVCRDELGACKLVVNVFDGGPRTNVTYEIAGHAPAVTLQRVEMADPVVSELFKREPGLQAPWVKAVSSPHMWTAALSPGLQPGAHRLIIRATDEYGRPLVTNLMMEVTKTSPSA
jgi:hypothetical protein